MSVSQSRAPGPVAVPIGREKQDGRAVERYRLTGEARGPWDEASAHGGAPAALLARSALDAGRSDGLRLAGLNITFLGPVPLGEVTVESEVVKPGRRQRVVALRLAGGNRVALEARAVLLRRGTVDLPPEVRRDREPGKPDGMNEPGAGREVDQSRWAVGDGPAFHRTANTVRAVEGGPDRTGERGSAWFRLDSELVEGAPAGGVERAVAAADFGNGVAHPAPFGEYLFANCDLNVSLLRDPAGEWIGIDSRSRFDPGGAGVTTTDLYDRDGYFGAASQTLYVDRA